MQNERSGLLSLLVLLLGLAGCWLWLQLLVGPMRLASGMLAAADHLESAQKAIESGATKRARSETFLAVDAAGDAAAGLSASPLLDVARVVPRADRLLDQVPHLVDAARHSVRAAQGTLEIAQNALKGPNRLIVKDPDDPEGGQQIRIDRVEELAGTIRRVAGAIDDSRAALKEVELRALPKRARGSVRDGLETADEALETLADARAGFEVLPSILGRDEPRTYLIAFQNTAEQRGTGGAILQFSEVTFDAGRVELNEKASTVYNVDRNRQPVDIPLPEDAWYVAGIEDAQRFGNANWSPDWPLSAELTVEYAKATPNVDFPEIDGVIVIDPLAIQRLMPGTGPFTTRAGNRISSGRVVHFLLYKAYASYPIAAVRRVVLNQVVDGFVSGPGKRGGLFNPLHPTALARGFGEALSRKHMQIWMRDPAEQRFIKAMDWDGSIEPAPKDDYVYAVEQNVGGNKLDYFDDNRLELDIEISGSDALHATSMRVHNGVFLPQPRYSMGDTQSNAACANTRCPTHRPMLNLYVPLDAELRETSIEGDGVVRLDTPPPAVWPAPDQPASHEERGKRVWSGTLQIPPQEDGALVFSYVSPNVVRDRDGRKVYRLHVQHQPKVRPEVLAIRLALPEGATDVRARGFKRDGDVLVVERPLHNDIVLEVSWQE